MLIGVPSEIKNHEYRVGVTPDGVVELIAAGHSVLVQAQAGVGSGYSDEDYQAAGATIVGTAEEVYARAKMIVKVKEPQPSECRMLRPDQLLFAYLHLAADPEQTRLLQESGATCIAFETVTDSRGRLPLLAPMSEIAGRMSVQAGAHCLEKSAGGSGVLLGGVPGVEPGCVLVLGGGSVGLNAARMAAGLGARVVLLDRNLDRLREIDEKFGDRITTVYSTQASIENYLRQADVVIGAVLLPGAAAPKLVTRAMLGLMKPGSVLVDVAIDQGGCFATSRATTHANPSYTVDGIVHYCVANMPGAVARTSTQALAQATLPYVLKLASTPVETLLRQNEGLRNGLNLYRGAVTCDGVAQALGLPFEPALEVLSVIDSTENEAA